MNLMPNCACGYDTDSCEKWKRLYPVAAGIELTESFDSLMARVRNGKRDAKLADRAGCFVERFDYASWVPDIHAIHHSMPVRSGGEMQGHYRMTMEEMGGRRDGIADAPTPACPHHWRHDFGVFAPVPGDVSEDRALVGYIGLVRVGDTATYMQIMGHGDWLPRGVMFRLHFDLMRWAMSSPAELSGCRCVWYTDFRGAPGLATWKRKAGFREVALNG